MADLSTSYMGIPLKNPVIAGASRLTGHLDSLKKIETAGAGAIVVKSLFEEQIEMERYELDDDLTRYDDLYAEMVTIHPRCEHAGPEEHLILLQQARDEISIPVFASLNAVHKTTWLEYARLMEKTGIAGLERDRGFTGFWWGSTGRGSDGGRARRRAGSGQQLWSARSLRLGHPG